MNDPGIWNLNRRCLFDILVPSLVGILVVSILMTGLYLLALRSLHATLAVELALYNHILDQINFYSYLTAISIALASFLFLLFAIKYISYLQRPLKLAAELKKYLPHVRENFRIDRGKGFVFKKLRERAIILVTASMGAPFLLLGGLYLAVISVIYKFCRLAPLQVNVLFQVLGYYGSLVLFVLIISGTLLISWSFYRLKNSLGLETLPPEKLVEIISACPEDYKKLEKEIEKILFLVNLETGKNNKSGSKNYE